MDTTIPALVPDSGRDGQGRFTQHNRGGPGNPFARQVGRLRKVLLDCVTDEDMAAIGHKLIALAREGNVQAIKLLFSYTLGKPAEAVQPDQLDVEEWHLLKDTAGMTADLPLVMAAPEPTLPLTVARAARAGVAQDMSQQMLHDLRSDEDNTNERPRKRRLSRRQRREQRRRERAERNEATGQPKENPYAADPTVRNALQTLADRDGVALRVVSPQSNSEQPTSQAPAEAASPSPNGFVATEDPAAPAAPSGEETGQAQAAEGTLAEETNGDSRKAGPGQPSANGKVQPSHVFGRLWPFGNRA